MKNNKNYGMIKKAVSTGRFFSVFFVKLDGTVRVMNCRTGVTCYMKAGSTPCENTEPDNVLTVWDRNNGYRCVRLNRIVFLSADNHRYYIGSKNLIKNLPVEELQKLF